MAANKLVYFIIALLVVAIWGVTFISTKVLINAGLEPAWIFVIRFVMAYAGIWLVQAFGKEKPRLWSRSLRDEAVLLLLGVSGGSLYFMAENSALAYTQASNVSFIVCTAPLLTAIFTLLYRRFSKGEFAASMEPIRLNWALILGTILALTGVALLSFGGKGVEVNARGDLLALAAAVCWGAYSLYVSKMTADYGEVFVTRKVFFYGLLTIVPFMIGSHFPAVELKQPVVIWNLLFLGIIASLVCFVVWNRVLKELGNVTATNFVYLNPFFTLATAIIVLGERLTPLSALGSLSIIAGVFIAGNLNSTNNETSHTEVPGGICHHRRQSAFCHRSGTDDPGGRRERRRP